MIITVDIMVVHRDLSKPGITGINPSGVQGVVVAVLVNVADDSLDTTTGSA